jgi:hypothetical protein
MAKEVGTNFFERERDEPCPRGSENAVNKGEPLCRGKLVLLPRPGGDVYECDTCKFTWASKFRVPQSTEEKRGNRPSWRLIPDELVLALAKAEWAIRQEEVVPDPSEREPFNEASPEGAVVMRDARRVLGKCWPDIGAWFEEAFGVDDPEAEKNINARRAIEEIAIPHLLWVEENWNVTAKPRLALEAVVKR